MPVRRSRSRLRPFLRVTRHSKARGAPSWRAIPCTSAELMASTAAETLRWVPILCPYSGFDRDFDRCCVPPGHAAVRLELSSCLFLAAPSCPAFLRPPTRRLVDTGDHSAHKAHGFDRFLSSLNSPPSRRFAISAPSPSQFFSTFLLVPLHLFQLLPLFRPITKITPCVSRAPDTGVRVSGSPLGSLEPITKITPCIRARVSCAPDIRARVVSGAPS